MKVHTKKITLDLEADTGMEDVSAEAARAVAESNMKEGIVTVFVVGSTAGVTTMEYEPGLMKDIPRALEKIAPSGIDYEHHKTWNDDNGKSHVRSSVIGTSLVVPFADGKLVLGTWQQIVVMNFDTSRRKREVVFQVIGE